MVERTVKRIKLSGIIITINYAIDYFIKSITFNLFRSHIFPPIKEFSMLNTRENANGIILAFIDDGIPDYIKIEYNGLSMFLKGEYNTKKLKYSEGHRIENESSFLLYSFVRLYKPIKIVETGVANGHSTFFLLSALKKKR